jgi:hypothetical protein
VLPVNTTFTNIALNLYLTSPVTLIGTTVSVQATLYYGATATTILCTGSPGITGVAGVGTITKCISTGLVSQIVPAGQLAYVQISATASGLSLENTITGNVSVGLNGNTAGTA